MNKIKIYVLYVCEPMNEMKEEKEKIREEKKEKTKEHIVINQYEGGGSRTNTS